MSEVCLVVREAQCDWSGFVHGSWADRAIAALSADPETLEELEAAFARYVKPCGDRRPLANLAPGLRDESHDAGRVIIDLAARLVVIDSNYSSPGPVGWVEYHNGQWCTEVKLQYHLAEDWNFVTDGAHWRSLAEQRRREREQRPVRDVRAVLYGRPLLEFIASETLAAFHRRDEIAAAVQVRWEHDARRRIAEEAATSLEPVDSVPLTLEDITPQTWPGQERYASLYYEALKQIHVAWMLTPRDDLGGVCPREAALVGREHIEWDLQDRCDQWSQMNECPPGLSESSYAYRHGGFGTHELVKYYELVRELLWSCWGKLEELSLSAEFAHRTESLSTEDFCRGEIPRLEGVREGWLDSPDPESHSRTPRSIIARERARLPEGVTGQEAMVDPDCPCCQMMGDMAGPWFWHLDGSGMDDEFAFDLRHKTREEWEEERRRWEEDRVRFDAELAERKRLGVSRSTSDTDGSTAVWSRSLSTGDIEVPLGVRVFDWGCRLAELIVDLRAGADRAATPPATQSEIDLLNRHFGNLREVLQSGEMSDADADRAAALIEPVLERFVETLNGVATIHRCLLPKCDSLIEKLRKFFDPPAVASDWGAEESGMPF